MYSTVCYLSVFSSHIRFVGYECTTVCEILSPHAFRLYEVVTRLIAKIYNRRFWRSFFFDVHTQDVIILHTFADLEIWDFERFDSLWFQLSWAKTHLTLTPIWRFCSKSKTCRLKDFAIAWCITCVRCAQNIPSHQTLFSFPIRTEAPFTRRGLSLPHLVPTLRWTVPENFWWYSGGSWRWTGSERQTDLCYGSPLSAPRRRHVTCRYWRMWDGDSCRLSLA